LRIAGLRGLPWKLMAQRNGANETPLDHPVH
jgi:hypothetical protein